MNKEQELICVVDSKELKIPEGFVSKWLDLSKQIPIYSNFKLATALEFSLNGNLYAKLDTGETIFFNPDLLTNILPDDYRAGLKLEIHYSEDNKIDGVFVSIDNNVNFTLGIKKELLNNPYIESKILEVKLNVIEGEHIYLKHTEDDRYFHIPSKYKRYFCVGDTIKYQMHSDPSLNIYYNLQRVNKD